MKKRVPGLRWKVLLLAACAGGAMLMPLQMAQSQQNTPCDDLADNCAPLLFPYTYDGQYYRAQLFPGEAAQVKVTFYSGLVYRLVACNGDNGQPLLVTLTDKKGNKLYDSSLEGAEPYWDFSFGASSEYIISARFKDGGGCATVLVGYKDE